MPTVIYSPFFGAETLNPTFSLDFNYATMSSASVNLIFWGKYWGTAGGTVQADVLDKVASLILGSHFLDAITQYGSDGHASLTSFFIDSSSDPSAGYSAKSDSSAGELQGEIASDINSLSPTPAPAIGSQEEAPIYVVVVDPSHSDTNGGYNIPGEYFFGSDILPAPINMISIGTSSGAGMADIFGGTFSHEMAERMTDPTGDNFGVRLNPPDALPANVSQGSNSQIGDNEPAAGGQAHYYYRLGGSGGAVVQPIWSNADSAFVVTDGNSQTITLHPNWTIDYSKSPPAGNFSGNYNLTIGPVDGTVTLNETGSGLQININGQTFFFDPGIIVSNTVNLGDGTDTVNIEGTVVGDSFTINLGAGTDTVNISPSAGNLGTIQENVTIHGGSGTDTLNIQDQNDTSSDFWTITGSYVTRTGGGTVIYDEMDFVNINGGFGNETYDVTSTETNFIITVNTGDGNDTVNVEGTTSFGPLTVNLGAGFDFVNIARTSQFLDDIQADVFVNGGSGTATLNVDDQADSFGDIWTITGSTITRNGAATIHYGFIDLVNINGGFGPETYNVNSTEAIFSITLNTGNGNDTVNMEGTTRKGPLTVNLGSGIDTVNITPTSQLLDNIPGQVTINGGVGSSDRLVLNDQANPSFSTWSVAGSSVARTYDLVLHTPLGGIIIVPVTSTVKYTHIRTLMVNGGSGGNEFDLSPTAMNLDELPATINLHGGGSSNTAFLDDQNNPSSSTWSVTGSSVTRTYDHVFITQYGGIITVPVTSTVNCTGLTSVALNGGSGGNDFEISPTANNLDELPDSVTVNGGGSSNTLNVYDQSNPNLSTWNIGSDSLNRTYYFIGVGTSFPITRTINYTSLTFLGIHGGGNFSTGAGTTMNITGTPASTSLDSGAGNDQLNVQGSAGLTGALAINGGGGNNMLIGPNVTNTWAITSPNGGTLDGTVTFTSIQNLTGGTAKDTFVFSRGKGVTGVIDGCGGFDTLDYGLYTSDVTVNLLAGTATGTGGVSNVENVLGSQGNDILVGDANANLLVGGGGRNLIIGGGVADRIVGGRGDNILIGGTTIYDAEVAALVAIMAEFTRTDEGFDLRVSNIQNGRGLLKGTGIRLNRTTVHADGSPDQLWSGLGRNWFLVDSDDIINGGAGLHSGDRITRVP
jgi:hypothetical protein